MRFASPDAGEQFVARHDRCFCGDGSVESWDTGR